MSVLVAQVRRARWRLGWRAFLRYACLTLGPALVAATIATQSLSALSTRRWLWIAIAAATGTAVAACAALLRAPSLRASATAIDRRLGLADVVAAAIELKDSSDPMAQLVVRGAVRGVTGLSLPRVFPLTIGGRASIAAASGVCALLLAGFAGSRPGAPAGTRAQDGSGGLAATSAPQGREGSTTGTRDARSAAQARRTRPANAERAPADGSLPQRPDGGRAPETSEARPDISAARASRDGGSPRSSDSDPIAPARGNSAQAGRSASSGSADRNPSLDSPTPSPASGAPRGRGGSGDAAASTVAGAGGVRGGRARPDGRGTGAAASTMPPANAARIRDARAQAEAAVSRDEVPPGLRAYVRDYFAALAPAGR